MEQTLQTKVLPKGWVVATIDEISLKINTGFSFGDYNLNKNGIPHIRPPNIAEYGELVLSEIKYVPVTEYDSLKDGDVLSNNTNSVKLVGKTTIISGNHDWAYSNLLTRIRTETSIINPKWINLCLNYLFENGFFKTNCKEHVNQASINPTFLAKTLIPLPPQNEQNRIVSKTDQSLSKINLINKSLKNAELYAEQYKQSFLKSVFEGKFTDHLEPSETIEILKEEFIQQRKSNTKKPQSFFKFETKLPTLPKNWTYVSLDFISYVIESGGTPLKSEQTNFDKKGIPLLKVENIDIDGNIIILKDQLRLSKTAHAKQFKSMIKENDVLFNIVGPPLGEIGFVTKEFSDFNINQALVFARTIPTYNPKLLFYCLKSPFYHNLMYKMGRGNRQDNIKKSDSELIPIPLIPTNHQKIMLEKLDAFFEQHKIILKNIKYSYNLIRKLRLSILKQAFEGKLVSQNSNDEHARILLEKIKKAKI